jgi:hypothetical protein
MTSTRNPQAYEGAHIPVRMWAPLLRSVLSSIPDLGGLVSTVQFRAHPCGR